MLSGHDARLAFKTFRHRKQTIIVYDTDAVLRWISTIKKILKTK